MSDTPLLEARDVRKVYTGGSGVGGSGGGASTTVAVDHVSLAISATEPTFTTLAGESGSGKTTMARLLLGLVSPTEGEVLYRGQPLSRLRGADRKNYRREVQAIFQDPFEVYNPFYRVDHLLHVPLKRFGLAGSRQERQTKIEAALEAVGLHPDETLGRYPHQLSGGQRQRITIARALLLQPRLIIADEPVSMVDASLRATILQSLHRLYTEHGISFIYITHDLTTAYQVSDQLVILYGGTVAEAGPVETIVETPQHPYTQELIGSIPAPRPGREWLQQRAQVRDEGEEILSIEHTGQDGCLYASRCAQVHGLCARQRPALYRTRPGCAVSCYLYDDAPTLGHQGLHTLWTKGEQAS
ncbi:MAG: ABC transporter ATP-binding protein [Gemmatimonadetes bacterium]|jgi:oligopeptide/dipeptide ABC transporter ATP-binding protein|nr:ABC transporter ATP-binding protein [Gemmatimonadota bacterium]